MSQIPDQQYRILIIEGCLSGKTNSLFSLINQQPNIDKIYFMLKINTEQNIPFLIKIWESRGLKDFNDSKAFIEYSNNIDEKTIQIRNIKY